MEITLKEIQLIELKILQEIHELCLKHEISYYMSGGTLLGAVRHKGFIPWDDDIDIFMPRREYNRFCEIAPTELPACLELQNRALTEKFPFWFSKVIQKRTCLIENQMPKSIMGVYVDIFPIDGLPANPLKRFWLENKMRILNRLSLAQVCADQGLLYQSTLLKRQLKRLAVLLTPDRFIEKQNKSLLQYDFYTSELVKNLSTDGKSREKVPLAYMGKPKLMTFEGRQFFGMAQAERYLSHFYGDYTQLPPEAERDSHHKYTAVYLDGWDMHSLFEEEKGRAAHGS